MVFTSHQHKRSPFLLGNKNMKWFKFYGQDYLSDPKILSLSGSERSCWITLLSYGSVNDNGVITFLSEDQLMSQSGIDPMKEEWDATKGILKKLEKMMIVTLDNEMITIINWRKRQEISLSGYERVKRYREKKRNDNDDNKNDNIRLDKNRLDKIRIKNKDCEKKDFSQDESFNWPSYLITIKGDKNKHVRIIGSFFEAKGLTFSNKKQVSNSIGRFSKTAKTLSEAYTPEELNEAFHWCMDKFPENWTLETTLKYFSAHRT